jgi:hypothetical protein
MRTAGFVVLAMCASSLFAQLALGGELQHENLKSLDALVGTWRFEGPIQEDWAGVAKAGAPLIVIAKYRWILDRSVLESEIQVRLKDGRELNFRGLTGWDPGKKRIVAGSMGSMGGYSLGVMTVAEGGRALISHDMSVAPDGKETSVENWLTVEADTLTVQGNNRKGFDPPVTPDSPKYTFKRQADGEKAFKAYAENAVGGVWTTTVDGKRLEHAYHWDASNRFLQLVAKGDISFVVTIGVDPETKQCTWWIFNGNGGVAKDVLTQEGEGVFLLEGSGVGPKGENYYRGKLTKVDSDTIEEEVSAFVFDGEKQKVGSFLWKRKR